MGHYLNPGIRKFQMALNSEIYVDKSDLIAKTNARVDTKKRFICISRPRRFGKTMVAEMLAAYYGMDEDAHEIFKNLAIANHESYEKHLNQYYVIMVNMQEFLSQSKTIEEMLNNFQLEIIEELISKFPEVEYKKRTSITHVMKDIFQKTKRPFFILIDEWDCPLREHKNSFEDHKSYLDFLRLWLKDQSYVGLAYMTGILPIKKYGTHSALNMFSEYSMTDSGQFINYFGFNQSEIEALVKSYGVDISEMEKWYNGYFTDSGNPIYNPTSVTSSLERKRFSNYWSDTETYEALRDYIKLDFDGLKEKVTQLISGAAVNINTRSFTNDMATFRSADDVLTLLVHLGYLTYNFEKKSVLIPNEEIKDEFKTTIEDLKWNHVLKSIQNSNRLLEAIWQKDAKFVAEGIGKVHEQNASILAYNYENALSCVISLALYSSSDYYTTVRELPSGKGYADLVFIPRRKEFDKPALVVELKWDKSVEGAIAQIKEKNYISALAEYEGNLLLIGINYDKETKKHDCLIEAWKK